MTEQQLKEGNELDHELKYLNISLKDLRKGIDKVSSKEDDYNYNNKIYIKLDDCSFRMEVDIKTFKEYLKSEKEVLSKRIKDETIKFNSI